MVMKRRKKNKRNSRHDPACEKETRCLPNPVGWLGWLPRISLNHPPKGNHQISKSNKMPEFSMIRTTSGVGNSCKFLYITACNHPQMSLPHTSRSFVCNITAQQEQQWQKKLKPKSESKCGIRD